MRTNLSFQEFGRRHDGVEDAPDGLIRQPAGVTLLVSVMVRCQQLLGRRHLCPDGLTRPVGLLEGEGVPVRGVSVVKHHT